MNLTKNLYKPAPKKEAHLEPLEIRIELMKSGVKSVDIAKTAKVSPSVISRVLDGHATSDRVQRLIAKAIGKKVEVVFPERYGKKDLTPGLERLAG